MPFGFAKRLVRSRLRAMGYEVVRLPAGDWRIVPTDFSPQAARIFEQVRDYTLTSPERVFALHEAVRFVTAASVPGAIVECGVWRGGSMMAVAQTLCDLGSPDRDLFLYDTFEGPPPANPADIEKDPAHYGSSGGPIPDEIPLVFQMLPQDKVKQLILGTGYPAERLHFVAGDVLDTLPATAPEVISILRLDTDSYSSTRHELEQLYPRVADGGIVIIDDYASYPGAGAATHEYLAAHGITAMLHRIDGDSRMLVVQR